jgi:hypothetical protein
MALKFDSKQAEGQEFTLLPEGDYEVFISEIDHGYAKTSGNEKLTVNYTVRDDVEQEGKGQKIRFDNFVNTENALWRFHALNKALEAQEGAEWEDFKEWQHFIKGKAVIVTVKHKEADFGKNKGKLFPEVTGFKPSQVGGEMKIAPKNNSGYTRVDDDLFAGDGQIDISDDDLPF